MVNFIWEIFIMPMTVLETLSSTVNNIALDLYNFLLFTTIKVDIVGLLVYDTGYSIADILISPALWMTFTGLALAKTFIPLA